MPWAKSFCPFRAYCSYELWTFCPNFLSGRAAPMNFGPSAQVSFQGVLLLWTLGLLPVLEPPCESWVLVLFFFVVFWFRVQRYEVFLHCAIPIYMEIPCLSGKRKNPQTPATINTGTKNISSNMFFSYSKFIGSFISFSLFSLLNQLLGFLKSLWQIVCILFLAGLLCLFD